MAQRIPLTLAVHDYDHVRDLATGAVGVEGVALTCLHLPVEEIFFRGFLQPRIGIALSSGFFVLAHLSYGQPFMLLGITLLSLIYAFLVRWRQTIWPAIAAHALFDGVQLLVIIPMAMRLMGTSPGAKPALAPVAALASLLCW